MFVLIFIHLSFTRSILSEIFNGKLILSSRLMLLYRILAASSPITKVLSSTVWFSTGGMPSLLFNNCICTQGKLVGIPNWLARLSNGSAIYVFSKRLMNQMESVLTLILATSIPIVAVTQSHTMLSLRIRNCPDKSLKDILLPSASILIFEESHSNVVVGVGVTVFLREAQAVTVNNSVKVTIFVIIFTLCLLSNSVPI